MVRKYEQERRVADLEEQVKFLERRIGSRNTAMANEMAAVRNQKRLANNNLAGATWEQSLSTEMQAIAAKPKALNDVDIERIKLIQSELATAKQQVSTR